MFYFCRTSCTCELISETPKALPALNCCDVQDTLYIVSLKITTPAQWLTSPLVCVIIILNVRLLLQFPTVLPSFSIVNPLLNRSKHEKRKLKFLKALSFHSFHETERPTAFYCFTLILICGRAFLVLSTNTNIYVIIKQNFLYNNSCKPIFKLLSIHERY